MPDHSPSFSGQISRRYVTFSTRIAAAACSSRFSSGRQQHLGQVARHRIQSVVGAGLSMVKRVNLASPINNPILVSLKAAWLCGFIFFAKSLEK
jgi:hypothetical protein